MSFITIDTSYPDSIESMELIKKLTDELLTLKIAGCIHRTKIHSSYIWENQIVYEDEINLTISTKKKFYQEVKELILKNHSYEIPQIIYKKIDGGLNEYFQWLSLSIKK